tara:strand:+ start:79 stop:1224 length:1146 start_codon:yes stop_codon:yes gene_type:complete
MGPIHKKSYLPFCFFSLSFLCACGGGGAESQAPAPVQTQTQTVSYDYTLGAASSSSAARSNLFNSAASLPYDAPNGASYSSVSAASATLNGSGDPIATVDTNASTAWSSGWTGKNVSIGVADGFNSNGRVDSHGDWVSVVISSVAPEANLSLRDILNNSTLAGLIGDVDAAYTYFENNGIRIINNSWGIERSIRNSDGSYSSNLRSDFDSTVNNLVAAYNPNSGTAGQGLYIYAAGNGAQYCGSTAVADCNLYAAVTKGIRDSGYSTAGSRLIWVGSLSDGVDTIASYSYGAGDLKYDFIVAHDDILASGDAAGTSFAAPRVSGAAALVKQKFPNLNSSQIKQVLLQTATDIGAPGVDDVYGYGKLNVVGSLSPQGTVIPR